MIFIKSFIIFRFNVECVFKNILVNWSFFEGGCVGLVRDVGYLVFRGKVKEVVIFFLRRKE